MSYPLDLDEHTLDRIVEEIRGRVAAHDEHKCDYCTRNRPSSPCKCDYCTRNRPSSPCRFTERHVDGRSGPEFLRAIVEKLTEGRCPSCFRVTSEASCFCDNDE